MVKKLLDLGNAYAKQSDWTDYAMVKFCLCAMGVFIGTFIPKEHGKKSRIVSGAVFLVTYLPLMKKVVDIGMQMVEEEKYFEKD